MDYNIKIAITVKSIESRAENENLVTGIYINAHEELILLTFTVGMRFKINEEQVLIGEFKKYFEVDYPLQIALGVLYNEEIHKTPIPCEFVSYKNFGKEIKYLSEQDIPLFGGSK